MKYWVNYWYIGLRNKGNVCSDSISNSIRKTLSYMISWKWSGTFSFATWIWYYSFIFYNVLMPIFTWYKRCVPYFLMKICHCFKLPIYCYFWKFISNVSFLSIRVYCIKKEMIVNIFLGILWVNALLIYFCRISNDKEEIHIFIIIYNFDIKLK